jgi:hypothetical protein
MFIKENGEWENRTPKGFNTSTLFKSGSVTYRIDSPDNPFHFDKDVFVESKSDNLLSNLESTIDPLYNNTSN